MSKILFRSPYKTTGSGQPPRSVYGENMPRTLLRRHDKYQARAGVWQRRRRKVLAAVIVIIIILGGDIAARRAWYKAGRQTGWYKAGHQTGGRAAAYRLAVGTTR